MTFLVSGEVKFIRHSQGITFSEGVKVRSSTVASESFTSHNLEMVHDRGALKMQDVKLQDVKMTDQVARHENAGHEIDGPSNKA